MILFSGLHQRFPDWSFSDEFQTASVVARKQSDYMVLIIDHEMRPLYRPLLPPPGVVFNYITTLKNLKNKSGLTPMHILCKWLNEQQHGFIHMVTRLPLSIQSHRKRWRDWPLEEGLAMSHYYFSERFNDLLVNGQMRWELRVTREAPH